MFNELWGDAMIKYVGKTYSNAILIQQNILANAIPRFAKPLALSSFAVTVVVSCSGVSLAQDVVLDSGNTTWTNDTPINGDLYVGYNNKDIGLTISDGAKV